jgi:MraZ protein
LPFRGTFDLTLDAKNRLTVPSKLRAAFADGIVVSLGIERCGALWRPADFEQFGAEALTGLHRLSPEYRNVNRTLAGNSWDLELDGSGRVMLDPRVIAYAGLDREVVVAGAGDCLEIWDRRTHQELNERLLAELPEFTERFGNTP